MTFRFAFAIAAAILVASSHAGSAGPREEKVNVVRQLAARVGRILGAASACREISQPRVKSITNKMMEVIMGSSPNKDELSTILAVFDTSVSEGERDLGNGLMVCSSADTDLGNLERAANLTQAQAPSLPPSATTPASLPVSNARGVDEREIRFGIVAPFSGPSKELGQQMKQGIVAAFNAANDAGGINGRQLRLVSADDGYEPSRTLDAMKQLYDKDQIFGYIGNVGTPTSTVAVPFALEHRELFFGAFTGANILRHDPPDRYVFNYRASYAEETESAVRYLVKVRHLRPEQIAVFAQQDSYGDSGFAGVAKAMRSLRGGDGGTILRLNYQRNTVNVDQAVEELRKQKVAIKAVVMVATYRAAAKFIEKTRDLYPAMIYTNVSFVGSTALANELMLLGPRFAAGVIVTQVVPAVEGYSSIILDYKNALAKYFPGESPDYVSLEGYLSANVLIEGLKRAGPNLDTEKVVAGLEALHDFDMGLGTPISFGRAEHQASHKIWGTQLDTAGKYQPFELQ
jgi:branched-chain amino acid transport system substrate-binding protein